MQYEVYDKNEKRLECQSFGKFNSYDEAYQEKTRLYHEWHMLGMSSTEVRLEIREVDDD